MAISSSSLLPCVGPATSVAAVSAMDLHSLKTIIRSAESVICEHGDAPETVGQVWEDWPEEILTGRLAASFRTRTTTNKLIKAYTKFA